MSVSYSQIAVFDGRLDPPFNNWTDHHVQQGFSWRAGSVSFKTLIHSGRARVSYRISTVYTPQPGTIRSIVVPFMVESGATIEIATIEAALPVTIEPGPYSLIYESGLTGTKNWIQLTFVPGQRSEADILVCDDELHPIQPLLMIADPA